MSSRLRKSIFIHLLVASYLLLSYNAFGGWWNSAAGTGLIILFAWLARGKDFLRNIGLKLTHRQIIRSSLAAFLVILISYAFMRYLGNGVVKIMYGGWYNFFHDVFYILNEEIVMGALVLFYLRDRKNVHPLVSVTALAVFFALIHYIFYKWIFDPGGILGPVTLSTLFLVGLIRNTLIISTGHIGYSWALHYGWMVVMFGTIHVGIGNNEIISEAERFNLYLGSAAMLGFSFLGATLSLVLMLVRNKK